MVGTGTYGGIDPSFHPHLTSPIKGDELRKWGANFTHICLVWRANHCPLLPSPGGLIIAHYSPPLAGGVGGGGELRKE